MFPMELVIERGHARCPFCVAVAEYRFIERERNLIRYEVHCGGCGERYREKLGAAVVRLPATIEPWLPAEQVPSVPLSERVRAGVRSGVTVARDRTAELAGVAAVAVRGWETRLTGMLARVQRQ